MEQHDAKVMTGVKPRVEAIRFRWSLRRVALGLMGLQLLVLGILSYREYTHFGLTVDYGIFEQAFWMLAHGQLNPHLTVAGIPFWRNHFELLMWPLAMLYWVWPNGPILLFVQDCAAIGTEWFAFLIIVRLVKSSPTSESWKRFLIGTALILLVMNPWTYWAESFDFHFHAIEACLITVSLWAFYDGRRRWGYILMICTLLASQVSTTYLVPAGATIFFMDRKLRRDGLIVALLGLGWFVFSEHLGVGGLGFVFGSHSAPVQAGSAQLPLLQEYLPKSVQGLLALVTHPGHLLNSWWSNRGNVWANLGTVGDVGLISIWGLVPLLVFLETALAGSSVFTQPSPSTSAVWALILVGSIVWASRAYIWHRWVGYMVVTLIAVNAIGWAFMGYQALPTKYTMASAKGSHTLEEALRIIPPNAEVVASQGILGRFVDRNRVYPFLYSGIPIRGPEVYFVISPYQGINLLNNENIAQRMAYLVNVLHASVVTHKNQIWVFRWHPPKGVTHLTWPTRTSRIMAWTVESQAGHALLQGSPSQWRRQSLHKPGYVLTGDYWRLARGSYTAAVSVRATGPIHVEVWNDTGNLLLARRTLPKTQGLQQVRVPFALTRQFPRNIFAGVGPFRYQPVVPTLDNNIEVRVWTAGQGSVDVYWVSVHRHS